MPGPPLPIQPGEISWQQTSSSSPLPESWLQELEPLLEPYRRNRCLATAAGEPRADSSLPTLHLDDVSDIPFLVDIAGVEQYQHRARLRARDGDLVASVVEMTPGYESYCASRLGMGRVEALIPEPSRNLLAVAHACSRGPVLDRLVSKARAAGGLIVHPYMGIEDVWQLARRVAERSGTRVEVVGPPPPVNWIANDKSRFDDVVRTVLGDDWLVETDRSIDIGTLASRLADFASRHDFVALKRLRCASAMGNKVFDSREVRQHTEQSLQLEVASFLERTEWDGEEPVLVVSWEMTDRSPSTQLWLPPAGCGAPRLDGIYDQILVGEEGLFIGSRPSSLPVAVQRRLGEAALRVGAAFQSLGYVGRCSFDHLVVGDLEDPRLLFTECNGRWGGTSSPMSLIDRLVCPPGSGIRRPWYRAQDFEHPGLVGADFREVLAAVEEYLLDPSVPPEQRKQVQFLFYNVGPLAGSGKLDVIALAGSLAQADDAVAELLPHLLGLS